MCASPTNRSSALIQERVSSTEIGHEPREQPKKIIEESKYDLDELDIEGRASMNTIVMQNRGGSELLLDDATIAAR